jgi:hypothetical protein
MKGSSFYCLQLKNIRNKEKKWKRGEKMEINNKEIKYIPIFQYTSAIETSSTFERLLEIEKKENKKLKEENRLLKKMIVK